MQRKLQKDLKKGDVIKVEYGDFDNWVTVVVDSISDDGSYMGCCIHAHNDLGREFEMWGCGSSSVRVVKESM